MLNRRIARNSIGIALQLVTACGFGAAKADDISASGNPGALIINSATAGSVLTPVSDATTTYNISITTGMMKITGEINSAMPANTALKVMLAAPAGATSVGMVALSATAQNLITGIANLTSENGLGISYEFDASIDAGVVSSAAKTVTFTIAAN